MFSFITFSVSFSVMSTARAFIESFCSNNNAFNDEFKIILENFDKCLWHQVSESLLKILKSLSDSLIPRSVFIPVLTNSIDIQKIYKNVVIEISQKMNPLVLLDISIIVIRSMDSTKASEFINSINSKFTNKLCLFSLKLLNLVQLIKSNELEDFKKYLIEYKEQLDEFETVNISHSLYYDVSSQYFKIIKDYTNFYHDSLKYLGTYSLDSFSEEDINLIGYDLCIAALCSDTIYFFGDLITHGIIELLNNKQIGWLVDLVVAINNGDMIKYHSLGNNWKSDKILCEFINFIDTKAKISCLVEICFKDNRHKKSISFVHISQTIDIPINEVEWLIMKALSLKLIKGTIDQINQVFMVTWIISRIIVRPQQIKELINRVETLNLKIGSIIDNLKMEAGVLIE